VRKRNSWLVLLFVIALVASACSSDDDGGTDTTQATTTTTTTTAAGGTDTTAATTTTAAGTEEPAIKTDFGVDVETKTIRLGLLADLTGPVFSTLVVPITDAQQVYWDNVNATGGIDGWTVELVIEDTMYDGPTHLEKYEKIRDNVVAISQSTGSPTSVANLPNTVEDDMLFIPLSWYSGWAIESFDSGNAFEQNTNYCLEAMNLVHFIQDHGGTKIAIATFPGDYGFDVAAGVKKAVDFYGLTLTYDGAGAVIPGQDYAAVIQGIATSGADWTIFGTNPSIGATILAGAVDNGYGGRFTGSGPSYHPALLDSPAAPLYDALYYQSAYNVVWGDDALGNVEMMDAMTAAYPDRRPDDAFIIGWNESVAMHRVLETAIASADLTRLGVKTAANSLTGIDFGGSQPNQSYAGTPDEFVLRSLAINDINLAAYTAAGGAAQTLTQADATTGSELAVDFFIGDAAAQYDFTAACYEL
jgi:ABC-type branched-subunit amino acid transport system substrate-binding protein